MSKLLESWYIVKNDYEGPYLYHDQRSRRRCHELDFFVLFLTADGLRVKYGYVPDVQDPMTTTFFPT
jgi:hypothetical protein